MRTLVLASLVLVSGCASSSGIVPEGRDKYMIGIRAAAFDTASVAKGQALREANEFCAKSGKEFELLSSAESPVGFGKVGGAEVHFTCTGTAAPKPATASAPAPVKAPAEKTGSAYSL